MRDQSNTTIPRAAPKATGRAHRLRALAFIVPALFFVKAAVLGLRIVPRWDVPDETAHFDYARDLWSGRGLARIGEAKIDADIATDLFKRPTGPVDNWTAHHPPTYYVFAGAAWKAATLVTQDENWLFRAPRLVSAFFGALTIFFIYKVVHSVGLGEASAVAVAGGFAAVPTFAWMSSGTNHDTMVAALGTASAWQFSDFMLSRRRVSLWWSVGLASLASATKITGLAVLVPLTALLALETRADDGLWRFLRSVTPWSVAGLALPGIWLVRNQILYGTPLAVFQRVVGTYALRTNPLQLGLFTFLDTTSQLQEMFVSFVGRIGWIGKEAGNHTWFAIGGSYLISYEAAALLLSGLAVLWCLRGIASKPDARAAEAEPATALAHVHRILAPQRRVAMTIPLVLAMAAALAISYRFVNPARDSWLLVFVYALCLFSTVVAAGVFVVPIDPRRRLVSYSILICAFFMLALLLQAHASYVQDGMLHFSQGRYLYPILGFLVAGPVLAGWSAAGRPANRWSLVMAIIICLVDAAFTMRVTVPYALGGS